MAGIIDQRHSPSGKRREVPKLDSAAAELQIRESAQEADSTSEPCFRELAETIEDVFWITSADKSRVLYVSSAYERIWGCSRQSLYQNPGAWFDSILPEDREGVRQAVGKQFTGERYDEQYRIIRPDGQIRWIRDKAFPVRNAAGQVERIAGVARDITEYREMAEQLRQSQKLDAIGQLAGGVAHDFNNILAAIILQAQLSATVQNTPKEVVDGLREIHDAAERAAEVVRQLLLFSRKQMMQARILDLNETVKGLAKLLHRIIGEDIQLQLDLPQAPLMTRADPGMLHQVLMNLAVNSRDAMPAGGRLLIQTAEQEIDANFVRLNPDAAAGRYVCLSVCDTGTGIAAEHLPHIFEPFFTTKEIGKGTGLGLSTVFGIVKQHGGFIKVESEPGKGSKFQILLPASEALRAEPVLPAPAKPCGGSETILLTEDDAAVRQFSKLVLERHGYRVLEAANGVQAIKLWAANHAAVAVLITDLVMPAGISGRDLAHLLQHEKPELKVILVSGYSVEVAGRQTELLPGENFLQKPFSPDQLLAAIRRCLDKPEAIAVKRLSA